MVALNSHPHTVDVTCNPLNFKAVSECKVMTVDRCPNFNNSVNTI